MFGTNGEDRGSNFENRVNRLENQIWTPLQCHTSFSGKRTMLGGVEAMVQSDNVPTRIAPIVSFPDLYWAIKLSVVFPFVLQL